MFKNKREVFDSHVIHSSNHEQFSTNQYSMNDLQICQKNERDNTTSIINVLQEMLSPEYSKNISKELLYREQKISSFLNDIKKQTVAVVEIILKVTLKASENNLMDQDFRRFFELLIGMEFSKKRLDTLISVELILKTDFETLYLLIKFLKLAFLIIPGRAYDIFYYRVHNLKCVFNVLFVKSPNISNEIKYELDDLCVLFDNYDLQCNSSTMKRFSLWTMNDDRDPPDNFREISILPSTNDLIETGVAFLRSNKSRGQYKSVDHYLDVHFRLMREDFIQPLRFGLNTYRNNDRDKRRNLRVYYNVRVLNTLPVERQGIVTNLRFDISTHQHIKWENSKRFMHGSLLCISDDNFTTFLFATVSNRDVNDLRLGIVCVKFIDAIPDNEKFFTLLETTNMCESYKHVLLKLQETNESNLSMKQYLVYGELKIDFPAYLTQNIEIEYNVDKNVFSPGNYNVDWPSHICLDLDSSQREAFKNALTKEIALIHGPPGTGKTFLGLKICRCLVENIQRKINDFGPILIVCYTNHALDQFLEGISKFTSKIVRIGSQSKSDKLNQFSLKVLRKNSVRSVYNSELAVNINSLKDEIIHLQVLILCSYRRLVNVESMRHFVPIQYFQILKDIGIKNWLDGKSSRKDYPNVPGGIVIEQMIYVEIQRSINEIAREFHSELSKRNCWNFENDQDNEINYINNQRQLDLDGDGLGEINLRLKESLNEIDSSDLEKNFRVNLLKFQTTTNLYTFHLSKEDKMSSEEMSSVKSLISLSIKDRWRFYRHCRDKYVDYLKRKSSQKEIIYEVLNEELNELHCDVDESIMRKQSIIGITTTGAARCSKILEKIRCKIILVEEAAEVLESHIVGSLNSGCEHLILIGDHKQLKPNPSVYELAKKYRLDISLFERLINNQLDYSTLTVQHRMRPEIAEIMQFIYPNLQNHQSVFTYPNVPSVGKNVFFLNHTTVEKINEDIMSYSNVFEANFVISFCRHLIKNCVDKAKITILTLYSGQMILLRSLMDKDTFGVRVCVVDNYQGEENDIILLSLVRSNEYEKIGFLSIENRICVSLSRARHGLYVFGNFEILSKRNELWKNICHFLKTKEILGNHIDLFCQNHPTKRFDIFEPNDFDKCPEGGCNLLCNQRLACGHACSSPCHVLDHKHYQCLKLCVLLCSNGHGCSLKCWEKCKPCDVKIEKIIPDCNHKNMIPCSKTPQQKDCREPCEKILPCNHKCLQMCRDKCVCYAKVVKVSPECGHSGEYKCFENNIRCIKVCNTVLKCGHICTGMWCRTCHSGRLHISCRVKYSTTFLCGHINSIECRDYFENKCQVKCWGGCSHNKNMDYCGIHRRLCTKPCQWKCRHSACSRPCHQICDRDVCNEPCDKYIACTQCKKFFYCYGICGEICPSVCLRCDKEVKKPFFGSETNPNCRFITLWTCKHSFEVTAMDLYMSLRSCGKQLTMKGCPKCHMVISEVSCFRYMNIIKILAEDIKGAQNSLINKFKIFDFKENWRKNDLRLLDMFRLYKVNNYLVPSQTLTNFLEFKYCISLDLVIEVYERLWTVLNHCLNKIGFISKDISHLIEWLNPNERDFNKFEILDFYTEFDRIIMCLRINIMHNKIPSDQDLLTIIKEIQSITTFSDETTFKFNEKLENFEKIDFVSKLKLEENRPKECVKLVDGKGLKYRCSLGNKDISSIQCRPIPVITNDRRKEIIKTIGLGRGRWFKCPKGHFYVIDVETEDESKCTLCSSDS